MKIALVIDFDGTVTEEDVGVSILNTFSLEDWHVYEKLYLAGDISLRDCLAGEYTTLPSDEPTLTQHAVETTEIRKGFHDFVEYCSNQKWPTLIVSGGLDFYIRAILDKNGLSDQEFVSGHAVFSGGKRLSVRWDKEPLSCLRSGTCKCHYVSRMTAAGYSVVFIGDGITDTCVVDKADYVFARHRLASYCEEKNIIFSYFNTFYEIKELLSEIVKRRKY